ncbi:hypothetical protein [Christiangramia marina]|uniref:hypothetical protein n=1 Tax=Christiangramia marina TaxID=409436 RepID=UPI003AA9A577
MALLQIVADLSSNLIYFGDLDSDQLSYRIYIATGSIPGNLVTIYTAIGSTPDRR